MISNTFTSGSLDTTGTPKTTDKIGNGPGSKIMRFEIEFSQTPDSAFLTRAGLKYNKKGWISIEWDDNSSAAFEALPILKKSFYSDGCGKQIPITASVAVNGIDQKSGLEIGDLARNVTYSQMKELIEHNWDIENHAYCHEFDGNYNLGNNIYLNIDKLDDLIFSKLRYRFNGLVVPTNYDGYALAAKNYGYLFSTSLQTFDSLPPAGLKPAGQTVFDFSEAPLTYSSFGRLFNDDWAMLERDVKKAIDTLITRENHYFRFASHTIDLDHFNSIVNYMIKKLGDKFLILPTREIMEYRIMTMQPMTVTVKGKKATVEIDTGILSDRLRWYDLSFLVKPDATTIRTVTALNGIDSVSFNKESGLINIFKQVRYR